MLVTDSSPEFFNLLTGVNNKIIEQTIIRLYGSTYGDDFISDDILDRKKVRDIIIRIIQEIPWQKQDDSNSLQEDKDKSSYVIKRLVECSWIEFIRDVGHSERVFNFTKNGKKFAQLLYSLSDEENSIIRQKNVRATKASLESYKNSNDPEDLVDAINSSKFIISDLTDNINDIKDEKNYLISLAMENSNNAGEKFIEFIDAKFTSNLAVKFGEDSAIKHKLSIISTIDTILQIEDFDIREKKLLKLFPKYKMKENPLTTILLTIKNRLESACNIKLPQLKSEISSYIQRGETILRQTNSLSMNKNRDIINLSKIIKQENNKEKVLKNIGQNIRYINLRVLNLSSIKVKKRSKKYKVESVLKSNKEMPKEAYIQSLFQQKRHLAFNYTQDDIKEYLDKHMKENSRISNDAYTISTVRDLLIAQYASDIVNGNTNYEIEYTKGRSPNLYFETDSYNITKKIKKV